MALAVAAGIIGVALAFAIACGNWAIPNDTAILQPTDTPPAAARNNRSTYRNTKPYCGSTKVD